MKLLDFHLSNIAHPSSKESAVQHCVVISHITKYRNTINYQEYKALCAGLYYVNEETFNAYKKQKYAIQ